MPDHIQKNNTLSAGTITQTAAEADGGPVSLTEAAGQKWTYMVYFATDNNLENCCLYDIIQLQQAVLNPGIDIYILVDRPAENNQQGDLVTVSGTYKWDSKWTDTRVGKITGSQDLTVTVDWESWGELDTGSTGTLERFVKWTKGQSVSENYGLIMWDHGSEDTSLCWDETPDPDHPTNLMISGVAEVLKANDDIPLVIFNNCLLGSEIAATRLAGSTEVIVASEPVSYGMSTYSYKTFFNTITADMTPQEIASVMVQNVRAPEDEQVTTMLTAIDVRDSRLGDALEAFAKAVSDAGSDTDKSVLVNAMKKAMQDGCVYDGSRVQQSDLYYLIIEALADRNYANTSESFKTALNNVAAVIEDVVLSYRCVPSGNGFGIAYCNTVYTAMKFTASGASLEKTRQAIRKHIDSCYDSNPLWGNLLYDLAVLYLSQESDQLYRPATFTVTENSDLIKGKTVSVSDLGCFSGHGAVFDGIALLGDYFFKVAITAEDTSEGSFQVKNDAEANVTVSLLSADGTTISTGSNNVSFAGPAPGDYFIRLQSDTDCAVELTFDADWTTGVDRFDYAQSGLNVKNADGNGTIAKATPLAEGYYPGLLTHTKDKDFYRIGDLYADQYRIVVESSAPVTVCEYDKDGQIVQTADFDKGVYSLDVKSGNYLLVTGQSNLGQDKVDRYSIYLTDEVEPEEDVRIDNLVGTPDGVSWEISVPGTAVTVDLSMDNFEQVFTGETTGRSLDILNLPAGTYQWRVKPDSDTAEWTVGNNIVSENVPGAPKVLLSETDGDNDLFCIIPNGTWGSRYYAQHNGSLNGWTGTGETVAAGGKNRVGDIYSGSADPNVMILTDSENGDALFLDDIYTALPAGFNGNSARLFRIQQILAGAGDDIVDLTSTNFEYESNSIAIHGGDGNDTIWANKIGSYLFGDAGNDRLVGTSGNDLLVGGIGNDSMHGGGGNDIFTFCENWGADTIEQLEDGAVTLWFTSGDATHWNAGQLTYTDGNNSVVVSGVSADRITLKFGGDTTDQYKTLAGVDAFEEFSSERIFGREDSDEGALASL